MPAPSRATLKRPSLFHAPADLTSVTSPKVAAYNRKIPGTFMMKQQSAKSSINRSLLGNFDLTMGSEKLVNDFELNNTGKRISSKLRVK